MARRSKQEIVVELEAIVRAGQFIVRLGGQCQHPAGNRINLLSGPGSFACTRCGLEFAPTFVEGEGWAWPAP